MLSDKVAREMIKQTRERGEDVPAAIPRQKRRKSQEVEIKDLNARILCLEQSLEFQEKNLHGRIKRLQARVRNLEGLEERVTRIEKAFAPTLNDEVDLELKQ